MAMTALSARRMRANSFGPNVGVVRRQAWIAALMGLIRRCGASRALDLGRRAAAGVGLRQERADDRVDRLGCDVTVNSGVSGEFSRGR